MNRLPRQLLVLFLLLLFVVPAAPASALDPVDPFLGCDRCVRRDRRLLGDLHARAALDPGLIWNGDLVIYAHGYVSPYRSGRQRFRSISTGCPTAPPSQTWST